MWVGVRHGPVEVLNLSLAHLYAGKSPCSCQTPLPNLTPAPPQTPQPSARCILRQPAAPWAFAGQNLTAVHTPHTGCSQSLQQLTILKKHVDRNIYQASRILFLSCGSCPNPHTYGPPPQAGHMHIQAHCFPGGEEGATQRSLPDSSSSLIHT